MSALVERHVAEWRATEDYAYAAAVYAIPPREREFVDVGELWPFDRPMPVGLDRVDELRIARALIDRELQRLGADT